MLQHQNTSVIGRFSSYLFWDTDRCSLDMEKHRAYIIKQVLEYGKMEDWELLCEYYGIPVIAEIAMGLRELEPRALTFIATVSKTSLNQFRCYSTPPSKTVPWNF